MRLTSTSKQTGASIVRNTISRSYNQVQVSFPREKITLNPLTISAIDIKRQKILAVLLEQIEQYPGKKLRRTAKLHRPRNDRDKAYIVTIDRKEYEVKLTHSIRLGIQNGVKRYYVLTHSNEDDKKYLFLQKNLNKPHLSKDLKKTNSTLCLITKELVKHNGVYTCITLSENANKNTQKPVAVKILLPREAGEIREEELTLELEAQRAIEKLRGWQGTHDEVLISNTKLGQKSVLLMDFLSGKDGMTWHKETKVLPKTNLLRMQIAMDLIKEAMLVHEAGYIHRDLKPRNIMVQDDRKTHPDGTQEIIAVKSRVIDLGLACKKAASNIKNQVGSAYYFPPEVLLTSDQGALDEQSDIYSLALTIAIVAFDCDENKAVEVRDFYMNHKDIHAALKASYDFSTIQYTGTLSVKRLLQFIFRYFSLVEQKDRPTPQWCWDVFKLMAEYEQASDNQKQTALQMVVNHIKTQPIAFKKLMDRFLIYEDDSLWQLILTSMSLNERRNFFDAQPIWVKEKLLLSLDENMRMRIQATICNLPLDWLADCNIDSIMDDAEISLAFAANRLKLSALFALGKKADNNFKEIVELLREYCVNKNKEAAKKLRNCSIYFFLLLMTINEAKNNNIKIQYEQSRKIYQDYVTVLKSTSAKLFFATLMDLSPLHIKWNDTTCQSIVRELGLLVQARLYKDLVLEIESIEKLIFLAKVDNEAAHKLRAIYFDSKIISLLSQKQFSTVGECKKWIYKIEYLKQRLNRTPYFSVHGLLLQMLNVIINFANQMPLKKSKRSMFSDWLAGVEINRVDDLVSICETISLSLADEQQLLLAVQSKLSTIKTGYFGGSKLLDNFSNIKQLLPTDNCNLSQNGLS